MILNTSDPPPLVQNFHARTFYDACAAAGEWMKQMGLAEITSQWWETSGGWSGTVYAKRCPAKKEG